ncbi:hypothetical protein L3i22_057640 [Actinoplanes sp. L3-i22]|nr:hypothetical protein L3i22_057640 [Actinoplanes sp. L3-i22]
MNAPPAHPGGPAVDSEKPFNPTKTRLRVRRQPDCRLVRSQAPTISPRRHPSPTRHPRPPDTPRPAGTLASPAPLAHPATEVTQVTAPFGRERAR